MIARHSLPVAVLMAVVSSACSIDLDAQVASATGRFDRTLQVAAPVDLQVRTGSGSITIRRGDDTEVRVTGHIRANRGFWNNSSAEERVRALEARPPVVQNGNSIEIGEITDDNLRQNISISYELTVPANTQLRTRSGSGSATIDAVQGSVDARTGSGSIRIGEIGGAVNAEAGSGSIEVMGAGKGLTAQTGSGSIRARDINGPVEARTGSGRIQIAYATGGDGDFSTGSGGISVTGVRGRMRARAGSGSISVDGSPVGDWNIDSGSGSVTLRLPSDAAFDLNARGGSIHMNHPIEARGALSRKSLQGRVRGGGPRIDISTGSGSIRLD